MLTNMELIGQLKSMPGAMEVVFGDNVGLGWVGIEEIPFGNGTKSVIVLRTDRPPATARGVDAEGEPLPSPDPTSQHE